MPNPCAVYAVNDAVPLKRHVRRIEVHGVARLRARNDLAEVGLEDLDVPERPAAGAEVRFVADLRVLVAPERNVEAPFLVDPVEPVVRRLVEVDEPGCDCGVVGLAVDRECSHLLEGRRPVRRGEPAQSLDDVVDAIANGPVGAHEPRVPIAQHGPIESALGRERPEEGAAADEGLVVGPDPIGQTGLQVRDHRALPAGPLHERPGHYDRIGRLEHAEARRRGSRCSSRCNP